MDTLHFEDRVSVNLSSPIAPLASELQRGACLHSQHSPILGLQATPGFYVGIKVKGLTFALQALAQISSSPKNIFLNS